jgi:hypothetical protein
MLAKLIFLFFSSIGVDVVDGLDRWWEEEGRREEWNGWIDEECVVDG